MRENAGWTKKDIIIALVLEFIIGINCYFAGSYINEELAYGISGVFCIPLFVVLRRIGRAFYLASNDKKVLEPMQIENAPVRIAAQSKALPVENKQNVIEPQQMETNEIDQWFEEHLAKAKTEQTEDTAAFYVGEKAEPKVQVEEAEPVENYHEEEIDALFDSYLAKLETEQTEDTAVFYVGEKAEAKVQVEEAAPVENYHEEEIDALFDTYLAKLETEQTEDTAVFYVGEKAEPKVQVEEAEPVENYHEEEIEELFDAYVESEKINLEESDDDAYCV